MSAISAPVRPVAFALIFGEQMAITPDGRTTTSCAGIWSDDQIEGHARVCAIIERMGGDAGDSAWVTPAARAANCRRTRASIRKGTWKQLPPDHKDGWTCVAPSAIPYGGGEHTYPVRELTVEEIKGLHKAYADAARRRALDAGYKWLEMHYAHGYLGASFFSPLANQRTDQYGGSVENRARFHLEALDAVRAVWPEKYPLTMRLGCDDLHRDGTQFEDSIVAIKMMKQHGLDLADLSLGFNTDEMTDPPFGNVGFMIDRANRVREEVGIPVGASWNLGVPENADRVIREELVDLVFLGRPALANPHWPIWAARELAHPDPFHLVQPDWAWWLRNFRGHGPSIGWPEAKEAVPSEFQIAAE